MENLSVLLSTVLITMGHIHEETVDLSNSQKTYQNSGLIEESPWGKLGGMYKRDRYARDRVMKSARLLLPYLSQDDKNPSTILDVGCFTMEAKKYFPRSVKYIGIDEKAYHRDTRVVDLHHGFEPIPCNLALCLETLEHLLDPSDTLESIHKSLPEEGRLVVSLPNEASVFHRIRCLLGVVDSECFSSEGKHLHLPSLRQAKLFLENGGYVVEKQLYYVSPSAVGSKQAWVGKILSLIPDKIHQFLADHWPSLFARGFIFLLKKRTLEPTCQTR